ncbi:hypothetical protein [Paraburkholderia phenoliruptrix]|uniref:Uncharacterized protein n=1 Tax=Paraburkholderia phenoliruptrix TaxID=252970 RepID=A0A6J5K3G2_9BURK|nr:hypothetical protein [Paraburkholderia phenoliruptrix]CAB4048501.1 hypothetical protein LMG9964_02142 [Paraburkholderia phenoliruptrix]
MSQIANALRSARAAIEHPQCGQTFQTAVADPRPFSDRHALAILLAVSHHPVADDIEKADAARLLVAWERKCSHWREDNRNRHNAFPELPTEYKDWQPFLDVATNINRK